MIITQMFNVCSQNQHDTSIKLTMASQSETPIEQFVSVTGFSSVETKSNYSMIPFAVVDIK